MRGRVTADLSRHPWANLPVTILYRVSDGIGQSTEAPPVRIDLPGRRFFDPTAAALIELTALQGRRNLDVPFSALVAYDD